MKLDSAVLYTNDIGKITKFYGDVLGMELDYRHGDAYVQFKFSNGVGLGIKKSKEKREVPGHQSIFIKTDDIEKDYKELKKKKLDFRKELEERKWGKEFSILDPDGNKIEFIERK